MSSLQSIIPKLTERVLSAGTWTITVDELEAVVDPVDLYRAVYELKLIGRDVYTESSAGELVNLLEHLGEPDAESRMRQAGLFLSHDDRIDLTARFVRFVHRAIVVHLPEPEMFRGMIRQFRRYDLAEQAYCDTYLPLHPVIDSCAAEHAEGTENAAVRELTAKWYLLTLFDRRIVMLSDLGPALFELLRAIGRQEGSLPPIQPRGTDSGAGSRSGADQGFDALESERDRRRAALAVLQINSPRPSRAVIQGQYRLLMRRFHPDVNPKGLERAKQINAAYGLLLASDDLTEDDPTGGGRANTGHADG